MTITRISVGAGGTQANDQSFFATFSPDGKQVVFVSDASNLVANDTNGKADVFIKDLNSGAIMRVSAVNGTQGDGNSFGSVPSFSANGNLVLFSSESSNLVANDTNTAQDVFIKSVAIGATLRVSTAADGSQANNTSAQAAFSPDGGKVVFASAATNLGPTTTGGKFDIFVKNLATGAVTLASASADGTDANSGDSFHPKFSPYGMKVLFDGSATNLVANDTNGVRDVFVKTLGTGAISRVSTAADGTQGNGTSQYSVFSPDGTKVAFSSSASNLVVGDTNGRIDMFVKDLGTGAITRVSTASDGSEADNSSSGTPVFSPDGTKIAFYSVASNLVDGDTNATGDIFIKDLGTGAVTRVPIASVVSFSDGGIAFSPDGSKILFASENANLVPGDTNHEVDIFLADVPVCFASGTSILTARGDVEVEHLVVGDIVVTASGTHNPIRWLGHRKIACVDRPKPPETWPVRIRAGAFGGDLPERDLFLSPGHPVLVGADADSEGGHLVPIMCLINGTTIARVPVNTVTYWHVELDQHDILLAEGLPAESYLDWDDRAFFTEASDHALANPDFVVPGLAGRCRPVALDGPVVEAERRRLDAVFAMGLAEACAWPDHEDEATFLNVTISLITNEFGQGRSPTGKAGPAD